MDAPNDRPMVGLLVTCLVDLFRPEVGFATVDLLERAGCDVRVPETQTCCGQPAFNGGDRATATALAKMVIEAFEEFDYVVAPSGSCIAMLHRYPELFAADEAMRGRAEALKGRAFEVTSFLVDVIGHEAVDGAFPGAVTYHDSCSGLRELGIRAQPRRLLGQVKGLDLREMDEAEACCGFGGTFCVKYPEISDRMVTQKCADIATTKAGTLLGGDLGCLLNIAGKLKRMGCMVETRHVVEVLAGMTGSPAIGEGVTGPGDESPWK